MTDEDGKREAAAKLAALREGFADRLRVRIEELELALESAASGEHGGRARAELLAHRLSGTAGSYGFPDVGSAAAQLEAVLRPTTFDPSVATVAFTYLRKKADG